MQSNDPSRVKVVPETNDMSPGTQIQPREQIVHVFGLYFFILYATGRIRSQATGATAVLLSFSSLRILLMAPILPNLVICVL
jgi:hypothetical protein